MLFPLTYLFITVRCFWHSHHFYHFSFENEYHSNFNPYPRLINQINTTSKIEIDKDLWGSARKISSNCVNLNVQILIVPATLFLHLQWKWIVGWGCRKVFWFRFLIDWFRFFWRFITICYRRIIRIHFKFRSTQILR